MAYDFQENSVGEIGGGTTVLTSVGTESRTMRLTLVCGPRFDE